MKPNPHQPNSGKNVTNVTMSIPEQNQTGELRADRSTIASLISRLRMRDRIELDELGLTNESAVDAFAAPCVLACMFEQQGIPHAIIAFHALTPKALVVSLMASEQWPICAPAVWRWTQRIAKPTLLAKGFSRAECRTMSGHDDAIQFLERLGFTRECCIPAYGVSGISFLQYAWRLEDHVLIQITQSNATTAAAPPGVASRRGVARTQAPSKAPRTIPVTLCDNTTISDQSF